MKTIAYVDGYNLYFSRLKHSPYKWLDLFTLFGNVIHPIQPESVLHQVNYYTADIKSKFASRGAQANSAQQQYHKALTSPHTGPVEIIKGYYTATKDTPIRYKEPPDKNDRLHAWKLEEKQTDVNIALDLYRDVVRGHCQQVVICSSDTDIAPALKYLRQDFPEIIIGLVFPFKPGREEDRHPPKALTALAHWKRAYLKDEELAAAQFKPVVGTTKKPAKKPDYW